MPTPIKVFVSYVPSEEANGIEQMDHILSQLQNQAGTEYRIDYWFDRYADEDRVFTKQAEEKIAEAHIILLLICPEYFRSDYIIRHEKPLIEKRLRERHKKGKDVQVIPIILAQLPYEKQWVFPLHLKTIPRNYRYPTLKGQRSWGDVWNEVAYRLGAFFEELHEELQEQTKLAAWRQEKLEARKRRKLPVIYVVHSASITFFFCLALGLVYAFNSAKTRKTYAYPANEQNNYTDTRFIGPTARCISTPCPDKNPD